MNTTVIQNQKHNYATRKYAQYKSIQTEKTLQNNLEGVYTYNAIKGEFKPYNSTSTPKRFSVHSLRFGNAIGQNYLFINFTNFQSIRVNYEVNEENEYSFTYNNADYCFTITPNEKLVKIEMKK